MHVYHPKKNIKIPSIVLWHVKVRTSAEQHRTNFLVSSIRREHQSRGALRTSHIHLAESMLFHESLWWRWL